MESALASRVIGQKEAIKAVAQRLRLNKGPLKENFYKPDGVLLFLGPTGVGRRNCEGSRRVHVRRRRQNGPHRHVRISGRDHSDREVDRNARGIVGSERGGILPNGCATTRTRCLLLDEIEKASAYLLNLFLQAFDEGWITDGRGKKVYLSDAIVIMTSNLGSDSFKKYMKPLGFGSKTLADVKQIKREVIKAAEDRFSPEFRNRIDELVVFSPLTQDEVKQIAELYLGIIKRQMKRQGKELEVSESAVVHLVEKGFSPAYGARFLKRTIDEIVKLPMTTRWKEAERFRVDFEDGELKITASQP